MSDYEQFLHSKRVATHNYGPEIAANIINPVLFPFQRDCVRWAVRKGRAAIFLDTGLGKTLIHLEWARLLGQRTLIVAPLSVARQTVREAIKLGIAVHYTRDGQDIVDGQNITNYEMLDRFNPADFGAVVLDESSILKALDGKTRRKLTEMFADTPFRLCCTATPAPNDHVELGNHAEFLGICTEAEMRAMFFINANKEHTFEIDGKMYHKKGSNQGGQEWRLKHHAEEPFYQWLASWAISLTKPSDLGYDDDGFILPALEIKPQFVGAEYVPEGQLFFTQLHGIADRAAVRRSTLSERLMALQRVIENEPDEQWVIWCGLDAEQGAVEQILGGSCVSVYGSLSPEEKEQRLGIWLAGEAQFLVSKPRVCGFGLNLQRAARMAFLGLGDSWEAWYQCIRRVWRYGQTRPVQVHIIMSDLETEIYRNVMRKEAMAKRLRRGLIERVRAYEQGELTMSYNPHENYEQREANGEKWRLLQGDSCERLKELADNSVDMSVYSPPFASLFVYSNTNRDLGNSRDWDEFFEHYRFIIRETLRVTKPGRLNCVHTSDIPAMQSRDGYIGIRDFPGAVIAAYEAEGWTFVGRAFVQKNPQAQAIRTKSKALLFVQLRKDSADSRPALVDQILLFRKPGENAVPIEPVTHGELDNETWIEWAHGIWLGINESDTLQYHHAREGDDEKHICPLQLGTIERCIKLYSNPGEVVLSPFAGIGSEGYQAIRFGRQFVGIELKPSYFEVAVNNLRDAEASSRIDDLFSVNGVTV
jgi:DNA modification methylase